MKSVLKQLPGGVVALGVVSLFMDASSEMIHALLPLFLTSTLGASPLALGAITGAGEAVVALVKLLSGVASDWLGRRKPLVLLGYGLAAATKPFFALAASTGGVLALHLVDRCGKGIRGAPRDALIADITPADQRGAAYGLRQGMDTAGAFIGPSLAMLLMWISANNIRFVFGWAIIPALLAVLTIVFFVREPEQARARTAQTRRQFPIRRAALAQLPRSYWTVVIAASALSLARFSEAFLLLRGSDAGLSGALVPVVMLTMNVVYAFSAYPLGVLADRLSRRQLLTGGVALLVAAHAVLALGGLVPLFAGVLLWGLHMGATQGLLSALVADHSPPELRATAFGMFNLAGAGAALAGGVLAGALWSSPGPAWAFGAGAVLASAALGLALRLR